MAKHRVTVLHTVHTVVQPITDLIRNSIPDVDVCHIVDETIIGELIAEESLTNRIKVRVCNHVAWASDCGAEVILFSCSSISPCADIARNLTDIPIIKIDDAMADNAISTARRIGVAATIKATLGPTISLLQEKACKANKAIDVIPMLCDRAFQAGRLGDTTQHDDLIAEMVVDAGKSVDLVVLAQASMARAVDRIEADLDIPILTSPESSIKLLKEILAGTSS